MPKSTHRHFRWAVFALFTVFVFTGLMGCASAPEVVAPEVVAPERAERGAMPYQVGERVYYPLAEVDEFQQEGIASWYWPGFNGKLTSNGEVFDMHAATAAHKTLPFNTRVRVINLKNQRQTEVRINDRGPFVSERIIDLSFGAARDLGMVEDGTAPVHLIALDPPDKVMEAATAYSVQVGVFESRDNALKVTGRLTQSRLLEHRDMPGLYRVLWGMNEDYQAASKRKAEARRLGYDGAFIVIDPQAPGSKDGGGAAP